MLVGELRLPVIEHPASRSPLYPHQAAMWDAWDHCSDILLRAKTGAGKTRAAMLPILKRNEWAVAIYPTNELVKDQVRAVARFTTEEGITPLIWTPETWQELELTHALAMVAMARGFGIFRRVVLLSATPDPEVEELLRRTMNPLVIGSVPLELHTAGINDAIARRAAKQRLAYGRARG